MAAKKAWTCPRACGARRAEHLAVGTVGTGGHILKCPRKVPTQNLTQLEMTEADIESAERIARALGYKETAYTSTSALWGLFCLPSRPTQRRGCVIKTAELGLMFVQDVEDLLLAGKV